MRRYCVRICNIDISDLVADTNGSTVKLIEAMVRAVHRIPNLRMGRAAFYMNRTIAECLDIQAMNKNNVRLKIQEYDGEFITSHLVLGEIAFSSAAAVSLKPFSMLVSA